MNALSNRSMSLIQKYFRDELSELEQKEFDKALEDPEFQTEVTLQAQVFEGLVSSRRDNLNAILQEAKTDLENSKGTILKKQKSTHVRYLRWLAVASFLLILVCSTYYLNTNSQVDYEAIYADYYVPYDTPESQRGDNEVENPPLFNAMQLYENEDYQQAISAIESIEPKTENINLLAANCYLNLDRWEEAESILKSLSQSNDNRIAQHAEWYLSLSYIKSDKLKLAKKLFTKIESTPNHLYHQRVIKVKEDYGF